MCISKRLSRSQSAQSLCASIVHVYRVMGCGKPSVQAHVLAVQFGLNLSNIQLFEASLLLDSNRCRHPGALPGDGAAHHIARRRVTDAVTASNATRADQILYALG